MFNSNLFKHRWCLLLPLIIMILFLFTNTLGESCDESYECGGSDIRYKACIDGECGFCETDKDCDKSSEDECNNNGYCGLSGFFEPFTIYDLLCTLTIFIGAMIAAGGGLGGGGIFIPTYILILSLTTATAAALSQATIFGGSIVNFVMNFQQNHPIRGHRPLPDLWLILIFEPMLLAGTIIGVIFNVIFPQPITLACLVITLSFAARRTLKKGAGLWKKETLLLAQSVPNDETHGKHSETNENSENNSPNDTDTNQNDNNLVIYSDNSHNNPENTNNQNNQDNTTTNKTDTNNETTNKTDTNNTKENNTSDNETIDTKDIKYQFLIEACGLDKSKIDQTMSKNLAQLEPFINEEKQIKKPLLLILVMWSIVSLFSILKSNVEGCSVAYWIITVFVFPFLLLLTYILSKKQVLNYQNKLKYGWIPCEGDVEWTDYKKALLYSSVAGIAGILGGLLGIGGGMIVSPLLLELHVLPRVASATSAMAVLVTSSSATLQFLLIDMLSVDYMLFFMAVGVIGTFFGQTMVNHCIKKYGRTSVVVLAIGTVIAMAVLLMGVNGIVDIANGEAPLVFSDLC